MTEFVLRVPEAWTDRIADAVAVLTRAGAKVTQIAPNRRALAGVVDSSLLGQLSLLPCADGVVEGARYHVDAYGRHTRRRHEADTRHGRQAGEKRGTGYPRREEGRTDTPSHRPPPTRNHPVDLLDLVPADDLSSRDLPQEMERSIGGQVMHSTDFLDSVDLPGAWPQDDVWTLAIPWTTRIAYGAVACLAMYLVINAAIQGRTHWPGPLLAQATVSALLFASAVTASLGFCRYRLVRHLCTGVGLLVSAIPCVLQTDGWELASVLGLVAFLISGTVADTLSR